MSRLMADFEVTLAGIPDPWTLFEVLAGELNALHQDADAWRDVERVPLKDVTQGAAVVAMWSLDGGVEVGSLPPGPNARIMLRRHQAAN
jgi:hypothetical protein